MDTIRRFTTCFIAGLLIVVLSLSFSVYNAITDEKTLGNAIVEHVDFSSLGLTEKTVRVFANETSLFLNDTKATWNPQISVFGLNISKLIPQEFYDHMNTLKVFIGQAKIWFMICLVVLIICLFFAFFTRKSGYNAVGYNIGLILPLVFILCIFLWAWIDFPSFWNFLHVHFIQDGIFESGEVIMEFFPVSLFYSYIPIVGMVFGGLCIAGFILPTSLNFIRKGFFKKR